MRMKPRQLWNRTTLLALWLLAWTAPAEAAAKAKQKKMAAPAKLSLTRAEPRGIQRGAPTKVRLVGTNLTGVTGVKSHSLKLAGELAKGATSKANELWISVTPAPDTPRGAYEISATGPHGESNRLKLFVDDIPQVIEGANKGAASESSLVDLPAAWWGTIEKPGDADEIAFEARAGQTLVFDLVMKSIGSKAASLVLTLLDAQGQTLASNSGFEDGGEPLLAYRFQAKGRYRIRVSDLMLSGSPDHYYRLSLGAFPFVTGIFPLGAAAHASTEIQLAGYNLPRQNKVKLQADKAGELTVPIDTELFRLRRPFKVLVEDVRE
ncbi:MAG: PPC domain-containing protein, partial [Pedosphaera parvula]|nr:PPC domain-containing protein [Pedosphaera parvula]